MSFQILDSNNNAIPIKDLDAEACLLWNKDTHPKWYAYPEIEPTEYPTPEYKSRWAFISSTTNWFDKIGWLIHDGMESWDDIRNYLLDPFKEFPKEEIEQYLPVYGYINLINHWESKGYKPVRVA